MAGKTLEKKMVKQIEIMHNQGLKIKEIARNLSLSKKKVKKYLRKSNSKYNGYPPDMQLLATETVFRQSEIIANRLTKN